MCVAVAAFGIWAIYYWGIREQSNDASSTPGNTSSGQRQTDGQTSGGDMPKPQAGPFTWQWNDRSSRNGWINYDSASAKKIEAAYQKYFKTRKSQTAVISLAKGVNTRSRSEAQLSSDSTLYRSPAENTMVSATPRSLSEMSAATRVRS